MNHSVLNVLWVSFLLPFSLMAASPEENRQRACSATLKYILYGLSERNRQASEKEIATLLKNDAFFREWFPRYQTRNPKMTVNAYKELLAGGQHVQATGETSRPSRITNLTGYGAHLPDLSQNEKKGYYDGNPRRDPKWYKIEEYSNFVLSLQAGDTVVFGNRSFKLGNFLGAGNTMHIFELADSPGEVIRIPFVAAVGAQEEHPSYWLKRYISKEPKNKEGNYAPIIEYGKGYIISKRVQGKLNGSDFFEALNRGRTPDWNTDWVGLLKSELKDKDEKNLDRLVKLETQMRLHKLYFNSSSNSLRQLVWDEVLNDWYLVDWE